MSFVFHRSTRPRLAPFGPFGVPRRRSCLLPCSGASAEAETGSPECRRNSFQATVRPVNNFDSDSDSNCDSDHVSLRTRATAPLTYTGLLTTLLKTTSSVTHHVRLQTGVILHTVSYISIRLLRSLRSRPVHQL